MKEDLLKIKSIIIRKPVKVSPSTADGEFSNQLSELSQKVDKIINILKPKLQDSQKKLKTKKEIISILNMQRSITSSQLSKLIGLSRTRCNEYLKEMEKNGIVTGMFVGRKRVYKLVQGL